MAQKIIERVEAHYESREMPFGKVYEWHQAYVVVECGCGQRWTLDATSTISTCQCGRDLDSILARGTQEREASLPDKLAHPWFYDTKERARQHQLDEDAYPEGSPWRYNDVTAASNEE